MADSEAAGLAALAQGGDLQARAELIGPHRRIVARLAKRYTRTNLSPDEGIRLVEQGLVIAIEKFNPTKGSSFSTYATWWIRQAITTGLGGGDGDPVRDPREPEPSSGSGSAAL
jgi:DNA-directed RNA polymerase sigma subunit (sigma70/sigma32)